ncbi:hypothetical protein HDU96_003332, partial [Phlyctochytrium bullatum]
MLCTLTRPLAAAILAVTVFKPSAVSAAPLPAEVELDARAAASDLKPFASTWGSEGNNYPIVMVHGLLGWGEK